MPHDVECTHCHVLMTSWAVPGSPVRYWQCPFCGRTHSSLYSEVFERRAGARRVDRDPAAAAPEAPAASGSVPQATADEIRWARLKARAARWFARLEQEQVPVPTPAPRQRAVSAAALRSR